MKGGIFEGGIADIGDCGGVDCTGQLILNSFGYIGKSTFAFFATVEIFRVITYYNIT